MNWYEVKLVTLQKLFSADTTEIVIDDTTMPYLSAMPGAANACLNYIASTVRHITKLHSKKSRHRKMAFMK